MHRSDSDAEELNNCGSAAPLPILVVSYGGIGDVIRALTTVRLIKARHPDRPIDLLCRPPVHLLAPFMPEIRRAYIDTTGHRRLGVRNRMQIVRQLRKANYARSYVFGTGFKTAMLPFLARVPYRVGFLGEGRYILLNRIRPQPFARKTLRDCALALEAGEPMPAEIPPPRLIVADGALAQWREREGIAGDDRPVLAIAPGASTTYRRWPLENFIEIARRAHARGWAIWVLGSPAEQPYAAAIAAVVPIRDFTPPPLEEVAYQIKAASVFLGNESGLLHVASALGGVVVGLFGPTGPQDDGPFDPAMIAVEPAPATDGKFMLDARGERSIAAVTVEQVDAAVIGAMQRAKARWNSGDPI